MSTSQSELRLPAIEVNQNASTRLYTFAVDGKLIPNFATVSRIRRTQGGEVEGYQRPEARAHIEEIREYLEEEGALIPNAVVIAFDERVRFEADGAPPASWSSRPGTLVIPLDANLPPEERPGFIVDGQQRLAAIRDAAIPGFPVCVSAFITRDLRQQTEQFILVNSVKPLPKALIYELLPTTDTRLPTLYERRRFPAYLVDRLNRDDDSPLRGRIQTPTTPEGVVKDNSLLKMLENSLTDGALYRYRAGGRGEGDVPAMLNLIKDYWGAVSQVFEDAWGLPPRRSRLMHGAGVVSLGFLMDAIADRLRHGGAPNQRQFAENLRPLKDVCRWTDGYWDFGPGSQRRWNELQNTNADIQLLTNYLLVQYKSRVWNSGQAARSAQAS